MHHAFSESALREQEPLLQKHCDVFVRQMRKYGGDRKPVNFREWFNFFTFDTIGDLSLGEDFRALESGEYHFWVRDIFTALKMWRVLRFGEMYSLIGWLLNAMIKLSPHFTEKRDAFFKLPITRVEKRLERQTDRKDFMSYVSFSLVSKFFFFFLASPRFSNNNVLDQSALRKRLHHKERNDRYRVRLHHGRIRDDRHSVVRAHILPTHQPDQARQTATGNPRLLPKRSGTDNCRPEQPQVPRLLPQRGIAHVPTCIVHFPTTDDKGLYH